MPVTTTSTNPPNSPEHRIIFSCLNRIRRRLWLMRLTERTTFAIAWGAAVALPLLAARLFWDRYLWLALIAALIPIAAAIWLELPKHRTATFNRIIAPPLFVRLLTILTVLVTLAVVTVCASSWSPRLPLWTIPTATLATFILATLATTRPVDPRTAAIFVDRQIGLQERVATALEFIQSPSPSAVESAFRQPVIDAALDACRSMRTAKVGYGRAGAPLYATALAILIAAAALSILTPLPAAGRTIRRPYVAVIEKSKKLENILNELEQKKTPETEITQKKLQPLKDTLADLRKGNMSPFEADARLSQEKGDLQKEQDRMDAADKVERALDNIKALDEVAKAGNQVKDAAIKNATGEASGQPGKQAANQAMKDAAKTVGDKMKNGGMSPDEKNKLADDLKKAADQAKGDTQLQQNLEKAAEAAKKGDGEQLAQNLGAAGQRMGEQRAEQQLSGDAVRQAMEAIDRANRDGGQTNQQNAQANAGEQSGQQQNNSGSPQANSGSSGSQQNGGQQQSNGGQKDGQGQGRGGGQQPGGSQGKDAQAGNTPSQGGGHETNGGGSTNLHAPSGPGDHQQGHPLGGTTDYVKVYDEKAINSQGRLEHVSGKINPLGAASGTQETLGQADKSESTIQTYESQLPAARKRALDDLQTQQIPPQYRDLIRNYYGQ